MAGVAVDFVAVLTCEKMYVLLGKIVEKMYICSVNI